MVEGWEYFSFTAFSVFSKHIQGKKKQLCPNKTPNKQASKYKTNGRNNPKSVLRADAGHEDHPLTLARGC